MQLIGISGTNGSGKDTIGHILADRYNFLFVSMSDFLRQELIRRNVPLERKNAAALSAEWRRQHGLGVLIDMAVETYNNQSKTKKYAGLAIAGLRNPGEADRVHELNGIVLWVDADPKIRYDRIQSNKQNRGQLRAREDDKTFEQFLLEEKDEMHQSGDEATLSVRSVKQKADIFIRNDIFSIDELTLELAKLLDLHL